MASSNAELVIWLEQKLAVSNLVLDDYSPAAQGYSNETIIFSASFDRDGQRQQQKFVQRYGPSPNTEITFFKEYDLERQCKVVQYIAQHSQLPVPVIVGLEQAAERPFYVMEFIEGAIPKDGHTAADCYMGGGVIYDDTPEQRRHYFLDLLGNMASINRLPVSDDFASYFQRPFAGKTRLEQDIAWWLDLYAWAVGDITLPMMDTELAWLQTNIPQVDHANIVWGDSRPANTLVNRDSGLSAMLDWELATLGPGELDLFWHLFCHQLRVNQNGGVELDGIPSEQEQIAHYETVLGRKIEHADFYRRLARIKGAILNVIANRAFGNSLESISFAGVLDDKPWKI